MKGKSHVILFFQIYDPFDARLDSASAIYRRVIDQASPISVLEPLSEDCSDSEKIKQEPAIPYG
jgi:hypothetical protein